MLKSTDINMNRVFPADGPFYKHLLIGCSDDAGLESVIPAETRHETFVHTCLGNLAPPGDLGTLASLDWILSTDRVSQVIVCGHYRCKAVEAAVRGGTGEFVGHWFSPLKKLLAAHHDWLSCVHPSRRLDALSELNTLAQVLNISRSPAVSSRWRNGKGFTVGAVMSDPESNSLQDLGLTLNSDSDVDQDFDKAVERLRGRWL